MNALKYTPDGGQVVVSGSLVRQDEVTDDLAGFVDIQVTDTGIGIDPENLELIFEKFGSIGDASLHSSSKTKFKGGGPGLGLPIAPRLSELHRGRIEVESVVGQGSSFRLVFPAFRPG